MAYIGKSPTGTGVRSRFYYTQTSGGGTSISGTDDNSKTLTFTDGEYIDVFLNGVLLVAGTDYNTNTANTISGLAALANGDVVEVVVYDIFTVADTVSASQGGTFNASVTMSDGLTVDDDGATPLTVDRATSFGTVIDVQKDGTNGLSAGVHVANNGFVGTGDTGLRFSADNDAVMPYNTSTLASRDNGIDLGLSSVRFKDIYLSGGVRVGGTGSANALDDYEEGTFNVTVSSGISVSSYDHDLGHYVKIGRQVTAWVFVEYNGSSRTSGHFEVSGLPFASSNDTSNEATMGGFITYQNNFSNAHNIIHMARNKTKVGFYELDGSQLIGSELSAASGEVRFVVQYTVA